MCLVTLLIYERIFRILIKILKEQLLTYQRSTSEMIYIENSQI
jgi:hypothetical protein